MRSTLALVALFLSLSVQAMVTNFKSYVNCFHNHEEMVAGPVRGSLIWDNRAATLGYNNPDPVRTTLYSQLGAIAFPGEKKAEDGSPRPGLYVITGDKPYFCELDKKDQDRIDKSDYAIFAKLQLPGSSKAVYMAWNQVTKKPQNAAVYAIATKPNYGELNYTHKTRYQEPPSDSPEYANFKCGETMDRETEKLLNSKLEPLIKDAHTSFKNRFFDKGTEEQSRPYKEFLKSCLGIRELNILAENELDKFPSDRASSKQPVQPDGARKD